MNILQSKMLLALALILSLMSCKAQTLPLNTALLDIPNGAYIKDTNNELAPYIGTYKTNFNGNEITLFLTKQENKLQKRSSKQFYRDALVIKYIVKNSSGTILQDTQNNNLDIASIFSIGTEPTENTITFVYRGTHCNVGFGEIKLKRIDSTQISWQYRPNDIVTTAAKCPPTLDTKIYLPETKDLIFTKQ
ncbi:DUF6705 family protein [Chryseobacterium lathyri]|uniref:DUF6705 family protein n=1 Tax=Chryseobacterium lathyri TaxID=395933 RepID=UPI001CBD03CF|nr:DUF6705 family protein [Chryseobacterium lathyri]